MERAFSPEFSGVAYVTQPVGLGWYSGAPLALFGRPLLSVNRTHFELLPAGVLLHAIALRTKDSI
jgi:hypothetical protein